MSRAFIPGLKALGVTAITRKRELPIEGEISVSVGDIVSASQVIATAFLPGALSIQRVPEKLGIEAFEALKGINAFVKEGQEVKRGELLCEHKGLFGLFNSRFVAPVDGKIEFISESNAHIGLRAPSEPLNLHAYISGTIVAIEEKKSVTIETSAALIQGIFGVGGEQVGELCNLGVENLKNLTLQDLPSDCDGKILFGGTSPSAEFLKTAADAGAKGLIVGSIDDTALTEYLGYDLGVAITGDEVLSMTLIITEGFGELAISERVMQVLKPLNGKIASINGATQVRAGAVRPEIIVPTDAAETPIREDLTGLAIGSKIRIIRVPYFGQRAEVVELPSDLTPIETGAMTRVLRAKLESGKVVTVPRANVELV